MELSDGLAVLYKSSTTLSLAFSSSSYSSLSVSAAAIPLVVWTLFYAGWEKTAEQLAIRGSEEASSLNTGPRFNLTFHGFSVFRLGVDPKWSTCSFCVLRGPFKNANSKLRISLWYFNRWGLNFWTFDIRNN